MHIIYDDRGGARTRSIGTHLYMEQLRKAMLPLGVTMTPLFQDIPISPLAGASRWEMLRYALRSMRLRMTEYKRACAAKPDLFISAYPDYYPKLNDVPRVMHLQDLAFLAQPEAYSAYKARYWRWVIGRALASYEGALSISQYTKEHALSVYGTKAARLAVVKHGVADIFHNDSPVRLNLNPVKFVSTSSHHKRKRLPLAVFIIAALHKAGINATLDIVGNSGNDTDALHAAIAKTQLHPSVTVHGATDIATLLQIMRQASGLLWTSSFEGFGLPVAEAMASGLPVFSVTNSTIPEITGGAYTELSDNPAQAAAQIAAALQDSDALLTQAKQAHAFAQHYTWARAASDTLAYWKSLCSH